MVQGAAIVVIGERQTTGSWVGEGTKQATITPRTAPLSTCKGHIWYWKVDRRYANNGTTLNSIVKLCLVAKTMAERAGPPPPHPCGSSPEIVICCNVNFCKGSETLKRQPVVRLHLKMGFAGIKVNPTDCRHSS